MVPNPTLKSASHLVNDEAKLVRKHQQDDEGFLSAMQMVSSIVLSMAMQSAVELGVFGVMAKTGEDAKLSAKEIADKISSKNPEASIMLDELKGCLDLGFGFSYDEIPVLVLPPVPEDPSDDLME